MQYHFNNKKKNLKWYRLASVFHYVMDRISLVNFACDGENTHLQPKYKMLPFTTMVALGPPLISYLEGFMNELGCLSAEVWKNKKQILGKYQKKKQKKVNWFIQRKGAKKC